MLSTWAQPQLTYGQWWAALEPMLSAQGQQDFAYTDPANIPPVRLTGTSTLREQAHQTWALVDVPTNVGTFGVELTRGNPKQAWRLSRLNFPEGIR